MERTQTSQKFPLGSKLPEFELPNVAGNVISSDFLKTGKAALVTFTCNHCPYVKGSEEMLVEIVRKFEKSGLLTCTINSNDESKYPDDNFEKMKEKAEDMQLPYPYLHDKSQEVARLFDAACTPECYLFDAEHKLVYHGPINDNPKDASNVSKRYLEDAINQVLKGEKPEPAFVHPLGCSIKWA